MIASLLWFASSSWREDIHCHKDFLCDDGVGAEGVWPIPLRNSLPNARDDAIAQRGSVKIFRPEDLSSPHNSKLLLVSNCTSRVISFIALH
jgi:hypothetical protein